MKFTKGQSGNPTGRPKGIKDKRATIVKEIVEKALGKEPVQYLIDEILALPSRAERVEHIERLLPYMHPKLQNIEHSGSIDSGPSTGEAVDKLVEILKELK